MILQTWLSMLKGSNNKNYDRGKNYLDRTIGSEVSIFGHFHHTKPSGHQVVTKKEMVSHLKSFI